MASPRSHDRRAARPQSLIAEELSRQLPLSVHFDYSRLGFVRPHIRSQQAYASLIGAGIAPAEARASPNGQTGNLSRVVSAATFVAPPSDSDIAASVT